MSQCPSLHTHTPYRMTPCIKKQTMTPESNSKHSEATFQSSRKRSGATHHHPQQQDTTSILSESSFTDDNDDEVSMILPTSIRLIARIDPARIEGSSTHVFHAFSFREDEDEQIFEDFSSFCGDDDIISEKDDDDDDCLSLTRPTSDDWAPFFPIRKHSADLAEMMVAARSAPQEEEEEEGDGTMEQLGDIRPCRPLRRASLTTHHCNIAESALVPNARPPIPLPLPPRCQPPTSPPPLSPPPPPMDIPPRKPARGGIHRTFIPDTPSRLQAVARTA